MKTFAFIFARGGSKGLPRKNILNLGGIPLVAHSILIAKKIPAISRIFVSTDDQEIAAVATKYGAEVIDRPKELAKDETPEWLAWRHAIEWLVAKGVNFDRFISLPATSPLRNIDDINRCFGQLDDETDIVVTITETSRSPFFNMVRKENGYVKLLVDVEESYSRRQDVPEAFDMTTVAYVARTEFIIQNDSIFQGKVKSVLIPSERSIDIDTKFDFDIAEMLIKKKNKE
jgi:N-acylneuraminate cytidylyltransferase